MPSSIHGFVVVSVLSGVVGFSASWHASAYL